MLKGIVKSCDLSHKELEEHLLNSLLQSSLADEEDRQARVEFSSYWEKGVRRLRTRVLLLNDEQALAYDEKLEKEGKKSRKGHGSKKANTELSTEADNMEQASEGFED